MLLDEPAELGEAVGVLGGHAQEAAVAGGLPHVQLGGDAGGAQRSVHADVVRQQHVAGAGGEDRRREPGEVAEQRRQVRVARVVTAGVQVDARPAELDSRLSRPSFVCQLSLLAVRSKAPVLNTTAAGIGRPSSLARSSSAAARFPPAEAPPTMISSGRRSSSRTR